MLSLPPKPLSPPHHRPSSGRCGFSLDPGVASRGCPSCCSRCIPYTTARVIVLTQKILMVAARNLWKAAAHHTGGFHAQASGPAKRYRTRLLLTRHPQPHWLPCKCLRCTKGRICICWPCCLESPPLPSMTQPFPKRKKTTPSPAGFTVPPLTARITTEHSVPYYSVHLSPAPSIRRPAPRRRRWPICSAAAASVPKQRQHRVGTQKLFVE